MTEIAGHGAREKTRQIVDQVAGLPSWLRRLGDYGLALLFVAGAAALRWALPEALGPIPFLAFYLAWVGAAAFGGLGPGLLATAASWLCVDLLFDPTGDLINFADPATIGRLIVLLAGGLTVSLVAERMRRGRIHERQQAREVALAKQEWERTFDAVPDLIAIIDPQHRILRANHAMAERLCTTPDHCPGMACYQAVHQRAEPPAYCPHAQTMADGREHTTEVYEECLGGHFLITCTPLVDQQGQMIGSVHVARDITQRKEMEEALRREKAISEFTIESLPGVFYLFDSQGRFRKWNRNLERISGYTKEEIARMHPRDFFAEKDKKLIERTIQEVLSAGQSSVEAGLVAKDGHETLYFFTGLATTLGGIRCVIGTGVDITERRRMEEALRELNATLENKVAQRTKELERRATQLQKLTLELAEAEDRERARLAEILHDDLQQVLAAAKFHLSLMKNRARQDAAVQATAAQIDHMLMDAIEKSRSLSHELSPAVLHHANLAETLGWLAEQVRTKHGLTVQVDAAGVVTTQSDALKAFLYRSAQELLFNVVKHARVNEARLRVRRLGGYICLSVSDRGRGFDPQEIQETAGFGLLSIQERIALLGGRMKIKSAAGQGATFRIVMPDAGPCGTEAAADPRPSWCGEKDSPAREEDDGRLRVLLVDDHEVVRQGVASLLSEEPAVCIVGQAANGREAVNLAHELQPDVVVMDVSMPLMNGDEATRQIKAHLPRTRIVALSMHEQGEMVESMRRAGADGYVLKTAPSEELLAAIRGRQADE
jgi:PAS domain S-box-containing protein